MGCPLLQLPGVLGLSGRFLIFSFDRRYGGAIAYLRQPANAKTLRVDPSRIVLIGHSMGGFMAVQGVAADPGIMAMGLISAADLGGRIPQPLSKDREPQAIQALSAGLRA